MMKADPPYPLLTSLVVMGVILIISAAGDIYRGWTEISAGGMSVRGVQVREPIHSGPVTSRQDPLTFWGFVALRLGLGLPAIGWAGYHLVKPVKRNRSTTGRTARPSVGVSGGQ